MVVDKERQKILVALASIRQHGNLDVVSGERNQKRALMNVAQRRRFVVWRGPELGYRLTRRGERFFEKHSGAAISSSKLKIVLGTRFALAVLMLTLMGVASADWFEWPRPGHSQAARITSTATVKTPAGWNTVANGPTTRDDASGLGLAATPLNSLEHNRQDPPPENTTSVPQARGQSTGLSTQHLPPQTSENNPHQNDRVHHVKRTKRAKREPDDRGFLAQAPAQDSFGYGWGPFPYGPWPYGWTR
jgi:hypothetical protein